MDIAFFRELIFLTISPIFKNDALKSSYMLYIFRNHYHVIGYSRCSNDNVSILDKQPFLTQGDFLNCELIPVRQPMNHSNVLSSPVFCL